MWEVLSFADKPYKGLSKAKVNLVTLQKFVSNIFMEGERETKDKQLYDGGADHLPETQQEELDGGLSGDSVVLFCPVVRRQRYRLKD